MEYAYAICAIGVCHLCIVTQKKWRWTLRRLARTLSESTTYGRFTTIDSFFLQKRSHFHPHIIYLSTMYVNCTSQRLFPGLVDKVKNGLSVINYTDFPQFMLRCSAPQYTILILGVGIASLSSIFTDYFCVRILQRSGSGKCKNSW